jgi:hypothetical protein
LSPEELAANEEAFKSYVDKGNVAFDEVISRSPESYLGYISKARLNSFLDVVEQAKTEKMSGFAKPHYEKALEIMLVKNDNGIRNPEIIEVYDYLGKYYYTQGEKALMGEYNKKILTIDPANDAAKRTLEMLDKMHVKY